MKKRKKNSSYEVSPLDIEVSYGRNYCFYLTLGGENSLLTSSGSLIEHSAKPLLEQMISEFDGTGESVRIKSNKIESPKFLGTYSLFSIQKDWVEKEKDDLTISFEDRLLNDPVLHPSAGPERIDQEERWGVLHQWIGSKIDGLRSHALDFVYYANNTDEEDEVDVRDREKFLKKITKDIDIAEIKSCYQSLSPEERTVVMMLHAIHQGPVLFPLALVLGKCSVSDYTLGIMAGDAILANVFGDVSAKDHRDVYDGLCADTRIASEYIQNYRRETPGERIRKFIEAGESSKLEFKSSLRWNLKSERNDEEITHACVKTIAAFLNSEGGSLLIGIADDGGIVGIEVDKFNNVDKFQLHLLNVLKQSLGEAATSELKIEIIPTGIESKNACLIACKRSKTAVYSRVKGGGENFYVRTGPSTSQLSARELVEYVRNNFPTSV
jgi:hypothetical protein